MSDNRKLIIFDWDGTLMDSEARIVACLRAASQDAGLPMLDDQALRNIIGLGLREALVQLYPGASAAEHDALVRHYRTHFLQRNDTPTPMFEGAIGLLQDLHAAGHYLAVATGKGRQGLDRVLAESGTADYFHATRCSDEAGSKPNPQMLFDIMDYLGIEAADSLMIGDTEYDMQMARNAGMDALAVCYGVHDKRRLLACEPLACVDSLPDLQQWLEQYLSRAA